MTIAIRLARRYAQEEQEHRAQALPGDMPDRRPPYDIDEMSLRVDLERAVEALPGRQRQVMRLYLSGKSIAEIAGLLAISPRTVSVHLHNARIRLRACLRDSTGE